jgi:hypothetical protein
MDDLYIARRSFDAHNGHLYTLARQRTQGTQNVYTPSNIDNSQAPAIKRHRRNNTPTNLYDYEEYTLNTPRLTSTLNPISPFMFEGEEDEEDILNHHISGGTQNNYSTPRMLDIIRSTSDPTGDDVV